MTDFVEHFGFSDSTCVIAFGAGESGRYEWGRTLDRLRLPHVLMRDTSRRWYADGVLGLGSDVGMYLRRLRGRYGRIVTLGLSSAGHAALRFGWFGRVDLVVAISPVTVAGEMAIREFPGWESRLTHDHARFPIEDLGPLYRRMGTRPRVQAFYSDGSGAELDGQMVMRLGLNEEEVTFVPGHGHADLAAALRDDGTIERVLRS